MLIYRDPNTPTPLAMLIDYIQGHRDVALLTEHGNDCLRQNISAVLPFLPAIILSGGWNNWTEAPVARAIEAVKASERRTFRDGPNNPLYNDPDTLHTEELEAHYITGLVVGLGLANALNGTTRPQQ